jgi:hypothetical protein
MPDQKLSQLTAAANVAGSDQLYIVQGGQSKRATASQLPISTATAAALADKDASGTAAAAITAHLAAVDHTSVTLGATVADVLGLTGQQLTADDPGAGADRLVFWDHSAGRLRHLALGSGLAITDTTIDAVGGTGGYPAFAAPTGFTVTGSGTASITLSFATGYGLPTTASQASWDAAAGLAATAIQPTDSRLTDAREWSAATVTQAAAEAGTETTRRAWTVQRVWQAAAAWWLSITGATGRSLAGASSPAAGRTVLELGTAATTDATAYATAAQGAKADAAVTAVTGTAPIASSGGVTPAISISAATTTAAGSMSGADKSKLDSVASGATANATDAQLRDRSTHTGTQSASTITGLAGVATSGAYTDLSGRPTLGTAAALDTGTAAGNVVALDGSARLPAVDGSQLTNLPGGTGGGSPAGTGSELQFRSSSSAFGAVTGSSVDGSGNITLGSRFTSSVANALSSSALLLSGTWITSGGTSTTTKPAVLIEPAGTTSSGWPTAGSAFGVNCPSGFTGWPIAVHQNGSLRFGIDLGNNRTHINNTGTRGDFYFDKSGGGGDPRMVFLNSTSTFQFFGLTAVTVPVLQCTATTYVASQNIETSIYGYGIVSRRVGGAGAVNQMWEGGTRGGFDEFNKGLSIRAIPRGTAPSATPTNATGSELNLFGGDAFTNATNAANGGVVTINGGIGYGTGVAGNVVVCDLRGFFQFGREITVAQLPAASATFRRAEAVVSDASSPTIGSAVVGGGSAIAKVWCNGSQWTVIGI